MAHDVHMDAVTFRRWAATLNLNKSDAAAKLGMSRNAILRYWGGKVPVPAHVALACAAVANGLGPWSDR